MKNIFYLASVILVILSCSSRQKSYKISDGTDLKTKDTIVIANKELEYEIIIIDVGFNSWLAANARPRGFFSQHYLESRNRMWVMEWNLRANNPTRFNTNLYQSTIDYQPNTNYGYEVNYMLFNYLTFFQLNNNTQFGSFSARIQ